MLRPNYRDGFWNSETSSDTQGRLLQNSLFLCQIKTYALLWEVTNFALEHSVFRGLIVLAVLASIEHDLGIISCLVAIKMVLIQPFVITLPTKFQAEIMRCGSQTIVVGVITRTRSQLDLFLSTLDVTTHTTLLKTPKFCLCLFRKETAWIRRL